MFERGTLNSIYKRSVAQLLYTNSPSLNQIPPHFPNKLRTKISRISEIFLKICCQVNSEKYDQGAISSFHDILPFETFRHFETFTPGQWPFLIGSNLVFEHKRSIAFREESQQKLEKEKKKEKRTKKSKSCFQISNDSLKYFCFFRKRSFHICTVIIWHFVGLSLGEFVVFGS